MSFRDESTTGAADRPRLADPLASNPDAHERGHNDLIEEDAVAFVELGRRVPGSHRDDDPHDRLFYLPDRGMVIAVECRMNGGGWWCGVIAAHAGRQAGHVKLSDVDLVEAQRCIAGDAAVEPDLFALLWQTRAAQRWSGGHTLEVVRILAGSLRRPGSLVVDIDTDAVGRLTRSARLRPTVLRLLLNRLIDAEMLLADHAGTTVAGTYRLALPGSLRVPASLPPLASVFCRGEGS